MAITHGTPTRTALADATVDRLDLGSAAATGRYRLFAADDTALVDILMPNPAYGAAANGVAAGLSHPLSGTAGTIAGGPKNATYFQALNRDSAVVFTGSVGVSSADMILSDVSIGTGQVVNITSASYTAPA